MNRVRMVNLDREYGEIGLQIDKAIKGVLNSARFIGGPICDELEARLAEECERKHCVLVGNGTHALELALRATDTVGKTVGVPEFTFGATCESAINTLNKAYPLNVDEDTFQLGHDMSNSLMDAVIPVSLFGLVSWPKKINFRGTIIEDAAQGFGGTLNGKPSGSFGHASTLSFYPTKTLSAYGDAGAVLTDDDYIAKEVRSLANHCLVAPYTHSKSGTNSRMDAIQAAIVLTKLKYSTHRCIERKREIAEMYTSSLSGIVRTPIEPDGCKHVFHQYTIKLKNRDCVQQYMGASGVETQVYYPLLMSEMKGFEYHLARFSVPASQHHLCEEVLSLPIDPYLTDEEVRTVIKTLREAMEVCSG